MSKNQREPGMAYSMPKLHKIMAILSFIFFVTVIWVFLDDYMRPWKAYQVEAMKIQKRHLDEKIAAVEKDIDEAKLKELNETLVKSQEIVTTRRAEIEKEVKELTKLKAKIADQTITNGVLNGQVGAVNFAYETASKKKSKDAPKILNELTGLKKQFDDGRDLIKAYQLQEKEINTRMAALHKEVTTTEKEIKDVTNTLDLLNLAKKSTKISPVFLLRNLPFIDFMDPTIKIRQIVINNVTDDRYFQQVPKVDRCITCHTFIDQPGFEKEANPFKTHPKLDLMVGIDSKHPMKNFGCTSCHSGVGQRVNDFASAAHMPDSVEQEKEWIKKYNWHEPHKVPTLMFTKSQTEASCVKCHQGVELIPQATVLNEGRMAIEKYGCNACHKIEGWEHKRKTGPSLEKIASKISKDWFKSWVWEPKSFNKHSRMPTFFMQSNNSTPEFIRLNMAEVNAIAEYVWDKSKPYAPNVKYAGGNADNGKELIKTIGCMGCHGVEGLEDDSKAVKAYAGPYLTGIGSKVSADWLISWVKKPSHFQEDSIMPSFRLSDKEANDITAYLMSLKNTKEDIKFAKFDLDARDELLVDYFSAFDTIEIAKKKVAAMDDHAKTMELGRRSISKYGCYSCHNVEGFDGLAPIGPELTYEGSKPVTQFGFGIQKQVPHRRDAWITAHLTNPRRWDIGLDKAFRDLVRMPNFYMTETEAKKITVALLGQVSDPMPSEGRKQLSAAEVKYHDAMKVINKYGCVGCHQIDGLRGDILGMFMDDINAGPPRLVEQGERTQTDWLYHFLGDVTPIRPFTNVRMPTFNLSDEEKNRIVSGLQEGFKQPTFEHPERVVQWAPGEKAEAKKLFDALNCIQCHTQGFNNEQPLAPDLRKASKRLRPAWIKKWIQNPQSIMPGTTMPNFFGDDGNEPMEPDYFGGDADKQAEALTKFVIELGL